MLIDAGRAYWCFDNLEEQEAERVHLLTHKEDRKLRHPHRDLTPEQQAAFLAEGRKPALRFATDDLYGQVSWVDGVRDTITFELSEIRDFNLIKSDGTPMYNWACVVDDRRMGITHVLRGEDGISNTPRQLLVYKALGWEPPHFSHVALDPRAGRPEAQQAPRRHRHLQLPGQGLPARGPGKTTWACWGWAGKARARRSSPWRSSSSASSPNA